jgi:hypothetical protein
MLFIYDYFRGKAPGDLFSKNMLLFYFILYNLIYDCPQGKVQGDLLGDEDML